MTPEEREVRLRKILDEHAEAARTFRMSSDAFDQADAGVDDAIVSLRRTIDALRRANDAQREMLNAIIAANEAAVALYNDDETSGSTRD